MYRISFIYRCQSSYFCYRFKSHRVICCQCFKNIFICFSFSYETKYDSNPWCFEYERATWQLVRGCIYSVWDNMRHKWDVLVSYLHNCVSSIPDLLHGNVEPQWSPDHIFKKQWPTSLAWTWNKNKLISDDLYKCITTLTSDDAKIKFVWE
jgi:hypothetical protein